MYKFCKKLKQVKQSLRSWSKSNFGEGHLKSATLKKQLAAAQAKMIESPDNPMEAAHESTLFLALNDTLIIELMFNKKATTQQQMDLRW